MGGCDVFIISLVGLDGMGMGIPFQGGGCDFGSRVVRDVTGVSSLSLLG